ncbi:endolytic transglycosylase MltG [Patescibacteria group bacterium]|nr:endolytic transglycosylase MltG [Patescibacteria group bacterium]
MRHFFIFLFLVFIFCVFLWQGIYLAKDLTSFEEKMFLVEKGQNIFQIAENLEKENLIKHRFYFETYLFLIGKPKKLQAGEYLLFSSMTIPEITRKIVSGDVIKEKITIIEGWNLRDIGWYLENGGLFQAEELFEIAGFPLIDYSKVTDLPPPIDFSQEFEFLKDKPKNLGLEGYLFPDTYEISRGESLEEIVKKILKNFEKKLKPELREEINRQEKTIFEIVTMASLIEKEVKTQEDRERVSGILWKRLNNNIPLQVDATITYITGKKTIKISREETQIDSPYNTYKYRGLPLGPICNPGLESILASLYPKASEYWYYLSTSEGETIFSKTLEEHNVAKSKYLK